jgi:hypothetical protein
MAINEAGGTDHETGRTMSPEEAFSVVGDETRLQILQALGEAEEPLTFSELYRRVDYDDTANFNYHLGKLEGHFVRKTDEGYSLRHAGGRIVEAILSGTVTEDPVMERTPVETPCFLCGGQMEVGYREERVFGYCTECGGTRGEESSTVGESPGSADDIVGGVTLPPAGVHDRTPSELLRAAEVWSVSKSQALARDVCPRCTAPITRSVHVCEDHDASDGRCEACDQQFAVTSRVDCTNCIVGGESVFTGYLLGNTDLMAFMIEHGIDPIHPEAFHLTGFEETVHSVDPFEGEFTFRVDGDAITLTVDDDLDVVDVNVEREPDAVGPSESGQAAVKRRRPGQAGTPDE